MKNNKIYYCIIFISVFLIFYHCAVPKEVSDRARGISGDSPSPVRKKIKKVRASSSQTVPAGIKKRFDSTGASPEQMKEMKQAYFDKHPEVGEKDGQGFNDRLKEILTPEQFEKWKESRPSK